MTSVRLGMVALIVATLSACNFQDEKKPLAQPGNGDDAQQADFAWLQTNLFGPSCHGCHNTGRSAGGIDLTSYGGATRGISAGAPAASIVFTAIDSGAMPPNGSTVAPEKLAVLGCWIESGADEDHVGCVPSGRGLADPNPSSTPTPSPSPSPDGDDDDDDHSDDDGGANSDLTDHDWLQNRLFGPSCHGCHSPGRSAGGVDVTSLTGVVAAQGKILHEVAEGEMPPRGPAVSAQIVGVLRCWIDAGATSDHRGCAPESSM